MLLKNVNGLKSVVFITAGLIGLFSAVALSWASPGVSHRDCTNCHQSQVSGAPAVVGTFIETSHSTEITITMPLVDNETADRCRQCHDTKSVAEKLLKKPFSELCVTCHDDKKNTVGSRHDVAYISYTPRKGACLSCHTPHPSNTETINLDNLWVRNLTTETAFFSQKSNPDYTLGKTILCYDCHSGSNADNEPDMASFAATRKPQDIAFSQDGTASTGTVGYYETDPPNTAPPTPSEVASGALTGGHYIKSPINTTVISPGDKLPCETCHDPHNIEPSNEAFIKSPLGGAAATSLTASPKARNGSGTGRDICTSCHGYGQPGDAGYTASAAFNEVNPEWVSTETIVFRPTTVGDHNPSSSVPCTDCHEHNRIAQNCASCHGYAPESGNEDYFGGGGAHQVHFDDYRFNCSVCHSHNGTGPKHGGSFPNNRVVVEQPLVDIDFDPFTIFPGGTSINNGLAATESYDATVGPVCYVGCHNPVPFYPVSLASGLSNQATWIDNTSTPGADAACTYCHSSHGEAVSEGSVAGTTYLSSHNLDTQARSDCEACHDISLHTQGQVRLQNHDDSSIVTWDPSDTVAVEPFCLSCHDADADQPFSSSATPPNIEADWAQAAHNTGGGNPAKKVSCFGDGLSGCHGNGHGSAKKRLLALSNVAPTYDINRGSSDEEGFCFNCHDNAANSANGISILDKFTANSNNKTHHNITAADQAATGARIECTDCHNTHTNNATYINIDPDAPGNNFQETINDVTLDGTAVAQPLTEGVDTYVDGFFPNNNYGNGNTMYAGWVGGTGGTPLRGLIKFDLGKIPADATITAAKVYLPQTGNGSNSSLIDFSLYRNKNSFNETSVNFNNAPAFDSTSVATAYSSLDYGYLYFENPSLTNLVQAWVRGDVANHGLTIRAPSLEGTPTAGNSYREFFTSDQPRRTPPGTTMAEQPKIVVSFTSANIPKRRNFVLLCGKCHDGNPPAGVVFPISTRVIEPNYSSLVNGDTHGAKTGPRNAPNSVDGQINGPYFFGIDKLPCVDCHDPHGSSNAYGLRETINGQSGLKVPTSITSGNYSEVQKFCGACHSVTHAPTVNCFSCHFHGANADTSNDTHF